MNDQGALESPDFQMIGGADDGGSADDLVTQCEPDPWLQTYVLSPDQVSVMIAESEKRVMDLMRIEMKKQEFRLQTQINQQIIKRQYLKALVYEQAQQIETLKKLLNT